MVNRKFECSDCGKIWEEPFGTGRPEKYHSCHGTNFHRVGHRRGYKKQGGAKMGPCGKGRVAPYSE